MFENAPHVENQDPLLDCLENVAARHGMTVDRQAVLAGLPVENGRLTPALLIRAAHRAGFNARLVERRIKRLPMAVLPAIVLLKGGRAGVIAARDGDGALELHLPAEADPGAQSSRTLRRDYTGFAVLLQPKTTEIEAPVTPDWWFWKTMWKFRSYYMRLLPASLLMIVLALVMPIFTMLVYDRVIPNDATETLFVLSMGVVIVFIFEFILRLVRGSLLERAGREMDMVLSSSLYDQVLALELRARPASAGVLAARTKAYEVLREFFMSATMLALADLPFALLMISVLFFIGGPVGWVLVIAATVAISVACLIQLPLRRFVITASESSVERQAVVSETINGLESVKGANAEGALQQRFESMVRESSKKDGRSHWYGLLGTSTTAALTNMTTVAVVVVAVFRVKAGEMTMGGMIACVMLASRVMMPIAMVAGLMTRLQQALQALRSLNAIMALPRETGAQRKFVHRNSFNIHFVLDNVSVRYPYQQVPALANISLTIPPGTRIALLGRIGSGKSTMLRVFSKLYEPTEGRILLDGVDLAQYHPAVLRKEIGYLPQDATVFRGTVRENVALGAHGATDEDVLRVLRLAGLEEFVKRNPDGLDAQVGEQGSLISGGQRQALVLARCLLSEPRLILLDEPTASMDPQTEKEFIMGLKRYLAEDKRRTLVVATHKTSMLELVDSLAVLEQGRIAISGDKASVLAKLSHSTRATEASDTASSSNRLSAATNSKA